MLTFNNVPIQLIDTPPLDRDYLEPELFDLIRQADIVLLLLDLQTYPDEQFHQSMAILSEHGIVPCRLRGQIEQTGHLIYFPFIIVVNKSDDDESDELFFIFCELLEEDWSCLPISAKPGAASAGHLRKP
jgi:ribosome-interacting GTPase 1